MIKLVAFDLDGTIGDTIPMCLKAFKMAVEPYIGYRLSDDEIFKTFGLDEEGMIRHFVDNTNLDTALRDFYSIYKENHSLCPQPFEGMADLIKSLKSRSVPLALITGKGKKSCEITLDRFGLNGLFDRIETGSSQNNRKSEAMKNILADYGLKPNEMVYICDAVSDIFECNKAGIRCLSVAWADSADLDGLAENNNGDVFFSIRTLKVELFNLLHKSN